jgi:hypothetical protein
VQDDIEEGTMNLQSAGLLMKPSFSNLFIKKLTIDRAVPIILGNASWLIFGIIFSVFGSSTMDSQSISPLFRAI